MNTKKIARSLRNFKKAEQAALENSDWVSWCGNFTEPKKPENPTSSNMKRYNWSLARYRFRQDRQKEFDKYVYYMTKRPLVKPEPPKNSWGREFERYQFRYNKWKYKMQERGYQVEDESATSEG